MKIRSANNNRLFILLAFAGIIMFIFLYLAATQFYPGGSQADKYSKGFSWLNNYWCNLLNETAINGEHNDARPIALTAAAVLGLSLSLFWYYFTLCIRFKKAARIMIQYSGMLAMLLSFFLFTALHDIILLAAGFFGLIALCGTFTGLYKIKAFPLLWLGFFNLFLILLNNYVYYSTKLIVYLPVIQKLSFLSFLSWVLLILMKLYQRERPSVATV